MHKLLKVADAIDLLSETTGRFLAPGIMIIMIIQLIDVFSRNIFNFSFIWAWDVNAQIFVVTSVLAGGYVLKHDRHVRMDLLSERLSGRTLLILEIALFPVFLITLTVIIWLTSKMALNSWMAKEHGYSFFAPPLYPLKTVFPIAVLFLLMQSFAKFIKNLDSLRKQ